MKKIALLFMVGQICINYAIAQDTVYVKAYQITRYVKSEIDSKIINNEYRKQGKSYEISIDYTTDRYYFTLEIDSKIKLSNEDMIHSILISNPDFLNIEIIKHPPYSGKLKEIIKESVTNYSLFSFDEYYYISADDPYLYTICYVEGKAMRIKINNDYLDSHRTLNLAIDWDITDVSPTIPSFYIYAFYEYYNISTKKIPSGFIKYL